MTLKNNTLMVVVRMAKDPENAATKMVEFTDTDWMTYMGIAERTFTGAQAALVLDADKNSIAAKRITGRSGNAFRLSKDSNAFGLEGWDFSGVLADKNWLGHPRVTATLVVTLDAKGNYNGGPVEVINWNEVDRAEAAKAKKAAAKKGKAA